LKNEMDENKIKSILQDKDLARLGDAYVNFIFSLAITEFKQKPTGIKVSDRILAEAAKKSGIRKILPKRMDRNSIANAVEAIIVYTWLEKLIVMEEAVDILKKSVKDPSQAITSLIMESLNKMSYEEIK